MKVSKALEMQEALISEYSKPEFQAKLRYVLEDTCSQEERRKIEQELRELRENVGAKFGFEASPRGVEKSILLFTSAIRGDPEVASNCNLINVLLYPQMQDELNAKKKKIGEQVIHLESWEKTAIGLSIKHQAELAAKYEAEKAARKKAFVDEKKNAKKAYVVEAIGRHWTVNGGGAKGIRVRKGEELNSPELPMRLSKYSVVEEMELIGDRLHYKKLAGEGPNYGWVSVKVKGAALLRPVPIDKMKEIVPPEAWGTA